MLPLQHRPRSLAAGPYDDSSAVCRSHDGIYRRFRIVDWLTYEPCGAPAIDCATCEHHAPSSIGLLVPRRDELATWHDGQLRMPGPPLSRYLLSRCEATAV